MSAPHAQQVHIIWFFCRQHEQTLGDLLAQRNALNTKLNRNCETAKAIKKIHFFCSLRQQHSAMAWQMLHVNSPNPHCSGGKSSMNDDWLLLWNLCSRYSLFFLFSVRGKITKSLRGALRILGFVIYLGLLIRVWIFIDRSSPPELTQYGTV